MCPAMLFQVWVRGGIRGGRGETRGKGRKEAALGLTTLSPP